jgi:alpha-1,6-mannosyltransferase
MDLELTPGLRAAAATTPLLRTPHLLDATMFWRPGGGVHRVISTKRAIFTASGWRHTLLAPGAVAPDGIDAGGLPIPASGGYRFVVARERARRAIERAAPDIVEAADPYTLGWAVLDACRHLHVPAVAFCHSNLPALLARFAGGAGSSLGGFVERRARRYLAALYERFDLVLAPSRTMVQQLADCGVPQARHQPLGVDCSIFTPAACDPGWRIHLQARLGLPVGTRFIVYHGRFAPEKDLPLVAEAVRLLGPGHALLAVGAGPCVPEGERVRVLPPEPDSARLARLIASSDAAVHAGTQETFGLAALEALACGTPLVASAEGGLGELAGEAGIAVHSRRPADWAAALHAALVLRGTPLTTRGLRFARAHDWKRVLELLAARYLRAMKARRREALTEGTSP